MWKEKLYHISYLLDSNDLKASSSLELKGHRDAMLMQDYRKEWRIT